MSKIKRSIQVYDRVEVKTDTRNYAGVVMEIITSNNNEDITNNSTIDMPSTILCNIKYYEYTDIVTLPIESVNPIVAEYPLKDIDIIIPYKCQCKYATDGQYYDCIVEAKTTYGYLVTYSKYGNSEEVPIEYLKPLLQKKTSEINNLINIPPHLQILPTDTEEEKLRKKKKIKAIKFKNRDAVQETVASASQSSWKSFVNKGSKKAMPGVVKSTIFASSEDVSSRVGITNSGKGLTEFTARKKHKFEPTADA